MLPIRPVRTTRADLDLFAWNVRFGKQDEPGVTARLAAARGGAVLVEHTARRETRVREITLDGRAPRRSDGLARYLRAVASHEGQLVILLEGEVVTFDTETFSFVSRTSVDDLATELAYNRIDRRAYAGTRGLKPFTQIVDLWSGRVATTSLPPPTIVLPLSTADRAKLSAEELWVSLPEREARLVVIPSERVETVQVIAMPSLARIERLYDVGSCIYGLGIDRVTDPLPFPHADREMRALTRFGWSTSGLELLETQPDTCVSSVLGLDRDGGAVVIEAPAKTHVSLRHPSTLETRAHRAFPKHGTYELATMVAPSSVLALRRYEQVDRAYVVRWGERTETAPLDPRIADAKVTREAGS